MLPASSAPAVLVSQPAPPAPFSIFACPSHGIFTSPNSKIPPPCCCGNLTFSPSRPARAKQALASDNRYEHLALTPSSARFSSPLLSVLNFTPNRAFKRSARGFWGLKKYIQEDWKVLESNLWTITQRLELWNMNTILDKQLYILPWKFGYLRLHPTFEEALDAVQQSHDAFCVWVGYCSYLMLLRRQLIMADLENSMHRWVYQLTHPVDPQHPAPGFKPIEDKVIKELEESELNHFSQDSPFPRAGVIVYDTCQFLNSVALFIRHNVPVYFFWGQTNLSQNYHPSSFNEKYRPTLREGQAAMQAAVTQHTLESADAPQSQSDSKDPSQIRHGRQQRPGEHPWAYLTRRAQEIADWYRQADAQEREAIDNRARAQRDFPLPYFPKGPICFLWEKDDDTQLIIQRSFSRLDVQQSWSYWSPSRKRFDPVERSWDIFGDPIPLTIPHYSQLVSDLSLNN